MGFGLPSEREMRHLQEAADLYRQLDDAMRPIEMVYSQDLLYDAQEALEQHQRIVSDLQQGDMLRRIHDDLEASESLRETLLANQLDLQRAAQEAVNLHEQIQDALGGQALKSAAALAEQHFSASLDMDRIAQITEQLDAEDFALTLKRAQDLLSDDMIADMLGQANIQAMLAQADIQATIRDAENAIADALSGSGEFAGEIAVEPPEWMRRLSRENLLTLTKLLILYIQTFCAIYGVSLALSDGNISDIEVVAVVQVLLTALGWASYLLENSADNDD